MSRPNGNAPLQPAPSQQGYAQRVAAHAVHPQSQPQRDVPLGTGPPTPNDDGDFGPEGCGPAIPLWRPDETSAILQEVHECVITMPEMVVS